MRSLHSLVVRLDALNARQVFFVVFLPLLAVYLATATRSLPYQIDAFTNTLAAANLGMHADFYLDEEIELTQPENVGNLAWVVPARNGHAASMYPPGTALLAAPFYILSSPGTITTMYGTNRPDNPGVIVLVPSLVPASIVAATATALALAFLALVFVEAGSPMTAIAAAYTGGLATGAWSVASDSLWQHGPAMLWIALGLYLLSRERRMGAGLAFGVAVLTRPHTALIAAAAGLWIGLGEKKTRPTLLIALGSSLGLLALVGYNWAVFGSPSITGGYGSTFFDQAIHSGFWWYVKNVAGALIDPERGVLVWAPFLIILIPGLARAWKAAPDWTRGAAVGGLLYLLLQLKANRFSGGDGHFAYRYPLEALTASAPLLLLAYREWVSKAAIRVRSFQIGVVVSVIAQAIGAIP